MDQSDICIVTMRADSNDTPVRFGDEFKPIWDFDSELNAPEIPAIADIRYEHGVGDGRIYMVTTTDGKTNRLLVNGSAYRIRGANVELRKPAEIPKFEAETG